MKKIITLIIAIIIVILGGIWFSKIGNQTQGGEPITIGFVGSLSGDLQTWGEESKNSINLAIEEINKNGGVKGRELKVIYEDGKCMAATAVSAARKLINIDKVKVLIPFCSQEALSIAPVALEEKVLEFVPAATIPELTNINEYVFRTSPSDKVAAETLANIISNKHTRLAILTENNDYSKSLKANFLTTFPEDKVVFDETYDPGLRDFRSFISKIKSLNPDAILINSNTTVAAGLIAKQLKELGLNIPKFGVYFGSDPEFVNVAGDAANGFTYLDFTVDFNKDSVKNFMSNYKERYGVEPPHPQFAILSYDAPYILKQAIESVGYDTEKIKDYLKSQKSLEGTFGKFEYNENGDLVGTVFKVFEIKDGKSVEIK